MAHLPARAPYARKRSGGSFAIVNTTTAAQTGRVPRDMSFQWLREQPSFDFFDVLHIHSLELAAEADIEAVLDRCERDGKVRSAGANWSRTPAGRRCSGGSSS